MSLDLSVEDREILRELVDERKLSKEFKNKNKKYLMDYQH